MAIYTEPTWTVSEERDTLISAFYDQPVSAITLTALFVRLLQFHFIDANHIVNSALKGILWNDDEELSRIFIGPGYAQNDKIAGQKPSIFVNRDKLKPLDIYIPSSVAMVSIGAAAPEFPVHHKLFTGTHILRVQSKSGAEAEALTEEVLRRVVPFAPIIQQDAKLRALGIDEVSGIARQESGEYAAVIAMSWSADFFYRIPEETAW